MLILHFNPLAYHYQHNGTFCILEYNDYSSFFHEVDL